MRAVPKAGAKSADAPPRLFKNQHSWESWLEKTHAKSTGLWLRLAKKDSGLQSISYAVALEVALCYGWIDGQKKPENDRTWLQRFVPRSRKSTGLRQSKKPRTAAGGTLRTILLAAQSCQTTFKRR